MGRQLAESVSVDRPEPQSNLPERVREWIEWFGLARLVTSAIATVTVCAGAFWLLRSPPPPTEAGLPVTAGSAPPVTLSPPIATADQPPATSAVEAVTVHVAGAVAEPGVYVVTASSRVDDAIAAAGGPVGDADVDALNLASPVVDGSRVYVPEEGELVAEPIADPIPVDLATESGPIDVNQATADQLDTLPGVGPATAAAIVTERERNGPFASVADLERVPGIGPAKLAALTDLVTT